MRTYQITLGEQTIGQLLETTTGSVFIHDEQFGKQRRPPILSQSLLDNQGKLLDLAADDDLVAYFANLIPEEGPLRRYLAARQDVSERDDFALLAVLGDNLPGAVKATLTDPPLTQSIDSSAQKAKRDPHWRFSLAGVQMKFSATRSHATWRLESPEHDGEWIVKLPTRDRPGIIEQEYAIMTLAKHCGLNVPDVELVDLTRVSDLDERFLSSGSTAFAIRRFDRTETGRVHQEDFCQIFNRGPRLKYGEDAQISAERVLQVVLELCGSGDAHEWLKRLAFSIAVGNGDAHLKNHALIYPDGVTPRLSPMYDVVCTLAYPQYQQSMALSLAGAYRFRDISRERLQQFASGAGVSQRILHRAFSEMAERLDEAWSPYSEQVSDERTRLILDHRIRNVLPKLV
ncbi:MAG: HipA domain-containing protein [Candidatus Eremiobacteraeota bacterium]|nr:HipA domain-containing protein [Candidatus Eremiobacteraeota bacterium]